jgi:hypothetical protein
LTSRTCPGGRQDVDVALGTQQVGLHRRAALVGQAAAGDVEYAAQDRVGAGGVLRTDLDTPTRRQHSATVANRSAAPAGSVSIARWDRSSDSHTSAGGMGSAAARAR